MTELRMMRFLLAAALVLASVTAFVPSQFPSSKRNGMLVVLNEKISDDSTSDFPLGSGSDEYKGDIDWDSEWKKVVRNQNQPVERPGKDFYKTQAEITAIKAANKAQESIGNVAEKIVPSNLSWSTLKGDWKFWIAVLVIISIGSSLLTSSSMSGSYNSDPYYI